MLKGFSSELARSRPKPPTPPQGIFWRRRWEGSLWWAAVVAHQILLPEITPEATATGATQKPLRSRRALRCPISICPATVHFHSRSTLFQPQETFPEE